MALPSNGPSSSDAVIQTLKWIRRQGFKPVPLRKASKAALDEKYTDPNYLPKGDDFWMGRDLGVGCLTGPKQGGPIDIDLDCQEAVFFARRFLPPSAALFGRETKRSSHYLYRVELDEMPKKAYVDPVSRSTIIELRGDGGHQTVFPGSIHEGTGELIEWEDKTFPDVPRVNSEALEKAVKKVAIATMVVRHMWSEGQRNEICKHLAGMFYYMGWDQEEVKDVIVAIMDYTEDTDRTRVRTVISTYKKGEKGGKITGSTALKKFMGDDRVVDRIMEWSGTEASLILQEYNERFAVVTVKGKFRVAETICIDQGEQPILFAKNDFLDFTAPETVPGDKGPVPKARIWLANPKRRTYRSLGFLPGVEDASPVLNLWTGWAVQPNPNASCRAWLDLMYYIICGSDDETFQWMLHWFANIVREPLEKQITAPVITGVQGAGKSLAVSYFGKILGNNFTPVTNPEHIFGKFNAHLATTLLLHSEEALYAGDKKHSDIIKSLITDKTFMHERKGVDAESIKNYLRLILTSNNEWAAAVEPGDRRYTILDLGGRKVKPELAVAVGEELNDGGSAALFHYLLTMDYDPKLARVNLKNEALATMKKIGLDPVAAWWYECLMAGQLLPDYLVWASRPTKDSAEWPQVVSSQALFASMCIAVRDKKFRYSPDQTSFSLKLNKMTNTLLERKQKYYVNPMGDDFPREIKLLQAKQYTIMNMPSLAECRKAFEYHIGQPLTWPQELDNDDKPPYAQF